MPPQDSFPLPSDVVLRGGDRNERVRRLNSLLQEYGFRRPDSNVPDGFDEATTAGIRDFQIERGLPPTGIVDEPTVEALNRSRCGLSAIPSVLPDSCKLEIYEIQGNPWHRSELTYRINNTSKELSLEEVSAAAKKAFSWWHDAVSELKFTEVDGNADIEITFFHGENHATDDLMNFEEVAPNGGEVLAHAFYPLPENEELAGDIHVNDLLTWKGASTDGYDLATVLAHEIGHALGIGHIPEADSVMYADYMDVRDCLTESDRQALKDIYVDGKTVYVTSLAHPEGGGRPTTRMSTTPFVRISKFN